MWTTLRCCWCSTRALIIRIDALQMEVCVLTIAGSALPWDVADIQRVVAAALRAYCLRSVGHVCGEGLRQGPP